MINRIFILIIITVLGFSCQNEKEKKQEEPIFIEKTQNEYGLVETEKSRIIIGVLDSLNNPDFKIPKILDDIYIDYKFYEIYLSYDKGVSTRSFIIDNIENIQVLEQILKSENNNFSIVPNDSIIKKKFSEYVYEMPNNDKSLNDIVRERIRFLSDNDDGR